MQALPVHWHEGMFLRPQHFQASERYWTEQLRQSSVFDQPYNWGVRRLVLDRDALKDCKFVILTLQARTPSGTIIRVPEDAQIEEYDFRNDFSGADRAKGERRLTIHLGVKMLEIGRRNINTRDDEGARFQVETEQFVSDENEPVTKREVKYRRLNLSLITNDQLAGFETIKLAEIVPSTSGENIPILAEQFLPPLLACDGWAEVREKLLLPLHYKAGQKMRELGEIVLEREITFQEQDPEARMLFEQLRLINEAAAMLRMLARTDGLHPLSAYIELSRIIGQLAILDANRILPSIPDYAHGDLGPCLWKLKTELDRLLDLFGGTRKYESRPFVGHQYQMRVDMDPRWLGTGWDMYISVKSNLDSRRVVDLLTGGGLNMKIASPERIEEVFKLGHRGMVFRHEQAPPKVLPLARGETYFSIQRTPEEWPKVQENRKVAIRLSERLLDGDLQDKRAVVLRAAGGQQQPMLQFTLYVVPPTI